MATIINPITTVLLNRDEFESGEYDRFPFKYIIEPEGTISYFSKLTAGRFILSHEAKVPGLGTNRTAVSPLAEIQPLAHGNKIPGDFFHQIKQFFLDVMGMGPSTYEAQVFIIWNTTSEDYRILVPEQTVSAAAVRYDIGDSLASDDIIIADIHSHNDMGAFFSGTDDRDDKKNPWISGVFGKLSTNMENKFRFNDGCGRHFDMKAEEVFDFKDARFQTPAEWLAKVKIQAPRAYGKAVKVSKVDSWKEAFGHASTEEETFHEGWNSGQGFGVDELDSLWSGMADSELGKLEDPESDLYDSIVDSLTDLSQDECRKVLVHIVDGIENQDLAGKHLDSLNDSEAAAFLEIDYTIRQSGDIEMAQTVLEGLVGVY